MNKILAVDGMMEPIATSTNTAISIKMSASPPTVYKTAFIAASAFSLRGFSR